MGDVNEMNAPMGIGEGRIDEIAQWLTSNIGARVVAYAAHTSRAEVARTAQGEPPDPAVDERLRCIYAVVSYMVVNDGPGSAHDFLVEPNAELDGRAPAELLHDGAPPEHVWLAAVPAF